TVTNGSKGLFTKNSDTEYTLVVTNTGSTTQTVTVAAGACTDVAENENEVASKTITIDRTLPTITSIVSTNSNPTNSTTITYVITMSENVVVNDGSKITVTSGTKSAPSISNNVVTIEVTGVNGNETHTLEVEAGAFVDIAQNENETTDSASIVVDTTLPTITSITTDKTPTNSTTITYTITMSENVVVNDVSKITVNNGTVGSPSISNNVITVQVTNATENADNTLAVASLAFKDSAGNTNSTSSSCTTYVDTTAPTCTITANKPDTTNASSITYTFTFSEDLESGSFTDSDISISVGSAGAFSETTLNRVYTLVVTNTGSCTQTVSINAGACKDVAGNNCTQASKTITIDRSGPALQSLSVTSPTSGTYEAGQIVTIVATFDEDMYNENGEEIATNLTDAPELIVKLGNGNNEVLEAIASVNTTIIYRYTIKNTDDGVLTLVSYEGTLYDSFENVSSVSGEELTGYEIEADNVMVTYNLNGGTSEIIEEQLKEYGEALEVSLYAPKKTNKIFKSWTATDGTEYRSGDSYTAEESTVLTANYMEEEETASYENFEYTVSGNNVTLTKYKGNAQNIQINELFTISDGTTKTVTAIASEAFKDNIDIALVEIPNTVTSIGENAFQNCTCGIVIDNYDGAISGLSWGLDTTLGGTVEYLKGVVAIASYNNYSYITDSNDSNKVILRSGKSTLSSVTKLVINNTFEISDGTFKTVSKIETLYTGNTESYVKNISNIEIASGIEIGNYAFSGYVGLKSISIPSTVTSIGNYAFSKCGSLTSISIPSTVTSIGEGAFSNCSDLTSISLPSNLTSIGRRAFENCSSLTSISLPSTVTSIDSLAFSGCSSLTSMTVASGNTVYNDGNGSNCIIQTSNNQLKFGCQNTVIPTTVTGIDSFAFYGCSTLTSITIPANITGIGVYAFSKCSGLTSITVANGNTTYNDGNGSNCIIHTSSNKLYFGCNNTVIPTTVTSIGAYAFYDCSSLTGITIPSGVASIETYAFYGCSSLTGITIPSGVTSISSYAFYGCSSLTGITIPSGVTSISSYAFCGCSSLTSITIPSKVTSIGGYAFYGCNSLTSITINSGVTSIGEQAFSNCTSLTSISLPSSVTSIGSRTFSNCGGLTSVNLPSGITSIAREMFYNCSSLVNITITSNVTTINDGAFRNCTSLTSINIPSKVTTIGDTAFWDCTGLTSISLPAGVTSIGRAFSGCSGLTNITVASGNTVYNDGNGSNCIIQTSNNTLLKGCSSTVIPNTVTSIGSQAFSNCSGLTSISIPSSVTSIGSSAFSNCSGLTSITVVSGNTVYNDGNGSNCIIETLNNKLILGCQNTVIPNSVTSIGSVAFSGLTSISIPSSITSIENSAFSYCSSIINILVDKNNSYYCDVDGVLYSKDKKTLYRYANGKDNTDFYLPNTVNVIGISSFRESNNLTNIEFTNNLRKIGSGAFSDCSGLTSVSLPSSLTSIGYSAFQNCHGLTSITVASGNKIYNSGNGSNCIIKTLNNELVAGYKNTVIPSGVTSIGNYAFYGCSGLTSISIPNSVKFINDSAFSRCSGLTSISLPSSVIYIHNYAFINCTNLANINVKKAEGSIPNSPWNAVNPISTVIWNP
ncbi:MAG: leucine-rich repeat protein, partial [Clostridia bacterium]|nr:leucine-rich repeat protein [Clostridia bacterium]